MNNTLLKIFIAPVTNMTGYYDLFNTNDIILVLNSGHTLMITPRLTSDTYMFQETEIPLEP